MATTSARSSAIDDDQPADDDADPAVEAQGERDGVQVEDDPAEGREEEERRRDLLTGGLDAVGAGQGDGVGGVEQVGRGPRREPVLGQCGAVSRSNAARCAAVVGWGCPSASPGHSSCRTESR